MSHNSSHPPAQALGKPRVMMRTDNFRLSMYPLLLPNGKSQMREAGVVLEVHKYESKKTVRRNVYNWTTNPATGIAQWGQTWSEYELSPDAIIWSLARALKQCYDEAHEFVDLDRSQT